MLKSMPNPEHHVSTISQDEFSFNVDWNKFRSNIAKAGFQFSSKSELQNYLPHLRMDPPSHVSQREILTETK